MMQKCKGGILGLVIALVVLLAGGTLSATSLTDNSNANDTSPTFRSAPTDLQNCQVIPSIGAPCSKDRSHSDAARDSHCQLHCGHSQIGTLSALKLTSPDVTQVKVKQNLQRIPKSVTLDPGSRPPNL